MIANVPVEQSSSNALTGIFGQMHIIEMGRHVLQLLDSKLVTLRTITSRITQDIGTMEATKDQLLVKWENTKREARRAAEKMAQKETYEREMAKLMEMINDPEADINAIRARITAMPRLSESPTPGGTVGVDVNGGGLNRAGLNCEQASESPDVSPTTLSLDLSVSGPSEDTQGSSLFFGVSSFPIKDTISCLHFHIKLLSSILIKFSSICMYYMKLGKGAVIIIMHIRTFIIITGKQKINRLCVLK